MIFKSNTYSGFPKRSRIYLFGALLLFAFSNTLFSQTYHINTTASDTLYALFNTKTTRFHYEIKPFYSGDVVIKPAMTDSIAKNNRFLQINASPYLELFPGYNTANKNSIGELFAGGEVNANISDKSALSVKYLYAYAKFPEYLDSIISLRNNLPGTSYAKQHGNNYSFSDFSFYANYKPNNYFTFEGGFGKNFFGYGYRSLFLSENSYSYPYLKIITQAWRIKYVNLFTQFGNFRSAYSGWNSLEKKYGSFQFLSWNVNRRLNLNFFESIIWRAKTTNHQRGFDINYLNPVIFLRPVEFSLGSPDNAMLGFGFHYSAFKSTVFYGQLVLDEFLLSEVLSGFLHLLHPNDSTINYGSWFNKQAFQFGLKLFDLAGVKNLELQSEFNYVRPYTYSHRDVGENYSHFNQSLAHPMGANFIETVAFLRYRKNKLKLEIEFMNTLTGLDTGKTHYGQDIFKPTYDTYMPEVGNVIVKQHGNFIGQGLRTTINYIECKATYPLVKKLNLKIEAGFALRVLKNNISQNKTSLFFAGINLGVPYKSKDY